MPEYLIIVLLFIVLITLLISARRLAGISSLAGRLELIEKNAGRTEQLLDRELKSLREESGQNARQGREEQAKSLKDFQDSVLKILSEITASHKLESQTLLLQFQKLMEASENKAEALKKTVEDKLRFLQEDNAKQLERMRQTVDEKLQQTLEKRLGESFKLVSERLEQVYKGLGEMQTLASGVGDLKRVLSNVKTRGGWGEIQLGSLLEQLLAPEQYKANVKTNPASNELVEFAIRLPGRNGGLDEVVWLPIDSKFPVEDYQRLVTAQEAADAEACAEYGRNLETRIKLCAKDICSKYISPPHTTDFGIMFLPTEGLYAEVVRRPELMELVQREYRVVFSGPTTFAALLNSLQMGFRTLAIEQRSSEVWALLGAVKNEFGKFGAVLDKLQKNLQQASSNIEQATRRTRAIERKLRTVEDLPADEAQRQLADLPALGEEEEVV